MSAGACRAQIEAGSTVDDMSPARRRHDLGSDELRADHEALREWVESVAPSMLPALTIDALVEVRRLRRRLAEAEARAPERAAAAPWWKRIWS